jgi:hypothetical protein
VQVVRKTPDELVLEERLVGVRGFGAFFTVTGVFLILLNALRGGGSFFFGLLFAAIGLAIVLLPRTTTINFDRPRRTVTLDRSGMVLGAVHREVALDKVRGVVVDAHKDDEGGHTYRVQLQIEGEEVLPFTEWWATGKTSKSEIKEQVEDWLQGRG